MLKAAALLIIGSLLTLILEIVIFTSRGRIQASKKSNKFKELKDKRGTSEYNDWFLNYRPDKEFKKISEDKETSEDKENLDKEETFDKEKTPKESSEEKSSEKTENFKKNKTIKKK